MIRRRNEAGQAAVELVAALPALAVALLVAAQLAVAGFALWGAAVAARAGARAAYVGGNGEHAARASLPPALRRGAAVRDGNGMEVHVRAPSLIPGVPRIPITVRAGLGDGDAR